MNRIQLLRQLIDEHFGGNAAKFARAIKRSPAQVHQWLSGHRNLGDAGARHIERTLPFLWQGFFDGDRQPNADGAYMAVREDVGPYLNDDEQQIIDSYRTLGDEDKIRIREIIDALNKAQRKIRNHRT